MINEVRINTLEELLPLISDQQWQPALKRNRSSYVYRGMSHTSYIMNTTLKRNCKDKQKDLEMSILSNFKKYAVLDDPKIARSVWDTMIAGQHHGLPTRLLDWTQSPLIALHFAVTADDLARIDADDCMVWRIDIPELHSLLPQKYKDILQESTSKVYTIEKLMKVCKNLNQYDEDMQDKAMVIIEPASTNARIVNQYSFFSITPLAIDDIEGFLDRNTQNTYKYIINKELRWRVCDMLDSINVSERIIYPGLDGLTQWIARHYYVR